MIPKKPKIGERHHWWPNALSQFWKNDDGIVHQVMSDGRVTPLQPVKFGWLRDGHNVLFGGIWDATIEPLFDKADSSFRAIVEFLKSETTDLPDGQMSGANFPDGMRDQLAEAMASLVVRSPQFRNLVEITVNSYSVPAPSRMGNLIAANINGSYSTAVKSIKSGGKFIFLYSRHKEYIYGDGHLNNVSIGGPPTASVEIVIPILPNVCIVYTQPIMSYTAPEIVKIQVEEQFVDHINRITHIYSKDFFIIGSIGLLLTKNLQTEFFTD